RSAAGGGQPAHPAGAAASPSQLPPGIADFTGREAQIGALLQALVPQPDGPLGSPCIAVVCGGGGIGKTSLAVHVARLAEGQYPDGALYANLAGVSQTPTDPADVLAQWLADLGVPAAQLPASPEARSARFRGIVRDRALLVLLDNARDAEQIRPLLPASELCGVLVT